MKLFITFANGKTGLLCFPSYEEARMWLTEHAKEVVAVSEIVG